METNALAAQALQVFRALIRDTRPARTLLPYGCFFAAVAAETMSARAAGCIPMVLLLV